MRRPDRLSEAGRAAPRATVLPAAWPSSRSLAVRLARWPPRSQTVAPRPPNITPELHDVVPDDRLDAAEHGVERHQRAKHDDHRREIDGAAGDGIDGQARDVERRCHPAEPPGDEDRGGQRAHANVEARSPGIRRRNRNRSRLIERKHDDGDPRIDEQPRQHAKRRARGRTESWPMAASGNRCRC